MNPYDKTLKAVSKALLWLSEQPLKLMTFRGKVKMMDDERSRKA